MLSYVQQHWSYEPLFSEFVGRSSFLKLLEAKAKVPRVLSLILSILKLF